MLALDQAGAQHSPVTGKSLYGAVMEQHALPGSGALVNIAHI
jgi:hypothetical protein